MRITDIAFISLIVTPILALPHSSGAESISSISRRKQEDRNSIGTQNSLNDIRIAQQLAEERERERLRAQNVAAWTYQGNGGVAGQGNGATGHGHEHGHGTVERVPIPEFPRPPQTNPRRTGR